MKEQYVLALDVGVTNIKAGLVAQTGRIPFYAVRQTFLLQGKGSIGTILVDVCREILSKAGLNTKDPVAIGCSTPGCVNPETGVIVASATTSWLGVDIRGPLENSFERMVTVEGDGAAAARGFSCFGPTRNQNHLLAIVLGTGISCGYMVDHKILRGEGQAALEAGHLAMFLHGRLCSCGRHGCWEAHAGGGAIRALLKSYRQAGYELPETPEELAELALVGHESAQSIWDEQGVLLGQGIAILLNVLNPRTVILAGGLANSWSLFKKNLLKIARKNSLSRNAEAAIVCASNPDQASLLGAAVSAVQAQGLEDFFLPE